MDSEAEGLSHLVALPGSGDKGGRAPPDFDALYRQFSATMRRVVAAYVHPQEVDAIVQQTFADYIEKYSQIRDMQRSGRLLIMMASYKAISLLRRNARWSGRILHQYLTEVEEYRSEAADELHRRELAMDLAVLTKGTPPEQVEAARLHVVEGCSIKEVADLMGVTPQTVRRWLDAFSARARKRGHRLGVPTKLEGPTEDEDSFE